MLMDESPLLQWFPLRVPYGRGLKLKAFLDSRQIENFIPMMRTIVEKDGVRRKVVRPAVRNLCFVCADRQSLDALRADLTGRIAVHYLWDKSTRQPLVVPEKAMRDFIRISRTMDEDLVYLSEVAPKLREGQRVRVLAGPFQGVEGVVVRVRKSKRVMVELPGMMAVATTFIQPDLLETLPGFPSAD